MNVYELIFLASLSHLSTWWLSMLYPHTGLHLMYHKFQAMGWKYGNRVSQQSGIFKDMGSWTFNILLLLRLQKALNSHRYPRTNGLNDSNWLFQDSDNLRWPEMLKEEHLEKGERRKRQRTIEKYKAWLSLNVVRKRTLTFLDPGPSLRRHCLWTFYADGLSPSCLSWTENW